MKEILYDRTADAFMRVFAGDTYRATLVREEAELDEILEVSRKVLAVGSKLLQLSTIDDPRLQEVDAALRRAAITLAPHDFHWFLVALEWDKDASTRFYAPREETLRPVVDAMTEMIVDDKYDILMLEAPPRIGKSTLGKFFVAWLIGREPHKPNLMSAYGEKIAKSFYDTLMELYDDPAYNYKIIFPAMDRVYTSAKDLVIDFRDDGKTNPRTYKSVTCRSIDGSVTGATECRNLLYLDDLVSDIEEAKSLSRLENLIDKLVNNLFSRKKEGCKELYIGTRWSVYDPMGWVEEYHKDNPRCKVIRIPALNENGESNFNYRYGVGFSTEHYKELQASYESRGDEASWMAMYQQEPIERKGILFPRDELKRTMTNYLDLREVSPPDDVFAFCDVAFGGGDYLAMPIAYQYGDDPPVIVDVVFVKEDYTISQPMVVGKLLQHKVQRVIFEANNGGDFYARDIADMIRENSDHKINIQAERASNTKSKLSRIIQHAPVIKDFVYLDKSVADQMYLAFLDNLTSFSHTSGNQNDDAPDALAGLATMLRLAPPPVAKAYDRRYL